MLAPNKLSSCVFLRVPLFLANSKTKQGRSVSKQVVHLKYFFQSSFCSLTYAFVLQPTAWPPPMLIGRELNKGAGPPFSI